MDLKKITKITMSIIGSDAHNLCEMGYTYKPRYTSDYDAADFEIYNNLKQNELREIFESSDYKDFLRDVENENQTFEEFLIDYKKGLDAIDKFNEWQGKKD